MRCLCERAPGSPARKTMEDEGEVALSFTNDASVIRNFRRTTCAGESVDFLQRTRVPSPVRYSRPRMLSKSCLSIIFQELSLITTSRSQVNAEREPSHREATVSLRHWENDAVFIPRPNRPSLLGPFRREDLYCPVASPFVARCTHPGAVIDDADVEVVGWDGENINMGRICGN